MGSVVASLALVLCICQWLRVYIFFSSYLRWYVRAGVYMFLLININAQIIRRKLCIEGTGGRWFWGQKETENERFG